MLRPDEIQQVLHAGRVENLNLADTHGPLGLEHLAAVINDLQLPPPPLAKGGGETLTITLRAATRQKLEQIANSQVGTPSKPIGAAELVAAIVEHFVASTAG